MVRFDIFFVFCLLVKTESKSNFRFNQNQRSGDCGWDSCNPTLPGKVNVHLVPHSHDDTGWLKTVDQYYYGAHQEVQRAGVQYIIESVIKELARDETKKFIQVETGFLWRWWESKDDFMRNLTLSLINSGQLQFAGGGWSMNDEATTHFLSIINNMEFGINWLKDNLGECSVPDVAWQIDPFGHSKEQARLFAEMGFKGLFFARIDYRDKAERKSLKELQMIWEGGEPGDLEQSIFTGVFDDHYSAPTGFCWDIICTDEPINDDPSLQEYNVDTKISEFVKTVEEKVKYYKDEQHIMFTMGDDFTYQNARQYYKNIDKLIKNMNSRTDETGIHVLYSTPSCYIKSLSEGKVEYPTKSDDFFPYASSADSYWTGFYSSRPSIKLLERRGMRDLTVSQQLEVASRGSGSSILFNMRRYLLHIKENVY
ncbi:lysosomal alpha-mannosidase [Eurytemora carolleeae]|uniref:lysosomal alpha-mannosidase n=1 Tax=Eurytemora carolleeae TaxID=1294199 RepID=UPI000C774C80|nr:lysosomal alpha-mannosidase [Eurytemora carolleeae]|eukprot:XP_023330196.1 lysosomal alpha-mannosidase-like [Eurytemora affinis]